METIKGNTESHHHGSNRYIIGLLLIIAGIVLLIEKTTVLPSGLEYFIHHIIFSWQMLLVTIGLVVMVGAENKTPGIVLMAVGGFFMIPEIFNEYFDSFNFFWPALFIIVGVIILVHSRRFKKDEFVNVSSDSNADMVDYVNIFSGAERQLITENFMGGRITSIFGGGELDLTRCHLAEGTHVLEITCIFGGNTVIVPQDWNVKLELTPILGGFSDTRKLDSNIQPDTSRTLLIKGLAIFGGGEIKCHK